MRHLTPRAITSYYTQTCWFTPVKVLQVCCKLHTLPTLVHVCVRVRVCVSLFSRLTFTSQRPLLSVSSFSLPGFTSVMDYDSSNIKRRERLSISPCPLNVPVCASHRNAKILNRSTVTSRSAPLLINYGCTMASTYTYTNKSSPFQPQHFHDC